MFLKIDNIRYYDTYLYYDFWCEWILKIYETVIAETSVIALVVKKHTQTACTLTGVEGSLYSWLMCVC